MTVGVVRDDHDLPAVDQPDPRDDTGGRGVAAVEAVAGERGDLEERAAGVEQPIDAVAGEQLAALGVPDPGLLGPAQRGLGATLAQLVDQFAIGRHGHARRG